MVNTAAKIKDAALKLFAERGFAKTSIGDIEREAGLAPRAGAFYRHFESKQALFLELARQAISEQVEDFDFEQIQSFCNTRAELVAIAQTYARIGQRQQPYLRVIQEVRLVDFGRQAETQVNEDMLEALMKWVASKPAGRNLRKAELAVLTMNVFGAWLFYLTKLQQGVELKILKQDLLLGSWADIWADILDES